MSVAQFAKTMQKHVIDSLSKKSGNALEGIDKDAIRGKLEQAKYHNAVFTRASFSNLKEAFKDSSNNFRLKERGAFVSSQEAGDLLTKANLILDAIDFDKFVNWIGLQRGRATSVETGRGIDTKIISSSLNIEERGATATYFQSSTDKASLILNNISQNGLKNLLSRYIQEQLRQNPEVSSFIPSTLPFIKANLEAGHLSGVFSLRIKNAFGAQYNESTGTFFIPNTDNIISKQMDSIMRLLLDADYVTSNIPNHHKLFAKAEKYLFGDNGVRATTELQLSHVNQVAGRSMSNLGAIISNIDKIIKDRSPYINKEQKVEEAISLLFSTLQPAIEDIRKAQTTLKLSDKASKSALNKALKNAEYIADLITKPSSPVILTSIKDNLFNILETGERLPQQKVETSITVNIPSLIVPALQQTVKEAVKSVGKLVKELKGTVTRPGTKSDINIKKKVASIRNIKGQFTSLSGLQVILNSSLYQQIKKNMVSPALRFRTGRFAESVKIERMSQSREGMVSAFYTYMKAPYQTFEPGFAQGSEKRNPKSLIAKSIREIASSIVGNRLRAISL